MEIKDYNSGDEIQILKLFNEAFGKPLSEEYWKWRFLDNPENQVMIKLMWDEDKLVGHYAVSPLKLDVNGESILTALSMTTMTHPDYAGKGIFTKLAEELYFEKAKHSDLKAVWGFPNRNSHYAFINKLSWNDLAQIPVRSIAIEKIKKSSTSNISVTKLFSTEHIKAQDQFTAKQKVKIKKSVDFLNWRYQTNPTNNYVIFELNRDNVSYYAVTKIFTSFTNKNKYEIDILELVFPPEYSYLEDLMIAIKDHYNKFDLLQINLWLSPIDPKDLSIQKLGFFNTLPITFLGVRVLDSKYDILKESNEWFYSMGDSDIY